MKIGTVRFYTLGCRLNLFESDGLASEFEKLGFKTAQENDFPDIIVINTCTVTNKADSKNRNIIRSAIKNHPDSEVWVTGCYAETDREVILSIPGVTGVVGNKEKSLLPYKILENKNISHNKNIQEYDRFSYSDALPSFHTRAYLKIQDGCNRKCSYCKIPAARGTGVSRKYKDILSQVKFLQDNGIGEIILTGVNIGWFKDDSGEKSLSKLIHDILNILDYSRLRISSIEPSDVNSTLSELLTHPRFCKFLHVPLQSGSNQILKMMKRSYTKETYLKRLSIIKEKNPEIFLSTDIITGFPSESEKDFQESIEVVNSLKMAKIHAFPFSSRKGTLAESFSNHLSKEIKSERVKKLIQLSTMKYEKYGMQFANRPLEAILEKDNTFVTHNFLKVKLANPESYFKLKSGQFYNVNIQSYDSINEVFIAKEIN